MKTKSSALLTRLAVCAVGFLASEQAHADDAKTYPGAMCQDTVVGTGILWGLSARGGGVVLNASADQRIGVSCPVVRDNTVTTNGIVSAQLYYSGNGGSFFCTFYSLTKYGSVVSSSYKSSPTGFVGDSSFTWSNSNISSSAAAGFYSIDCGIPTRTTGAWPGVYSYVVTEW